MIFDEVGKRIIVLDSFFGCRNIEIRILFFLPASITKTHTHIYTLTYIHVIDWSGVRVMKRERGSDCVLARDR